MGKNGEFIGKKKRVLVHLELVEALTCKTWSNKNAFLVEYNYLFPKKELDNRQRL